MNRRRKACRAAAVWAAVLLLIPAGRTAGEQVYPTYTYDYRGEALESPALYQPVAMQLGADMQTTPLKEPQGEGVALGADHAVFIAGEGGGKGQPGTFARFTCAPGV